MAAKILIVEDEKNIALGLQINLEGAGFTTEVVGNGLDAIERIKSGSFDLVLLDVMLPGVSGFDVCEKVRESGNYVPVLFLTARGDEDDRVRGLQLGGDDYITKPFKTRELIERIRAILRRQEWFDKKTVKTNILEFGNNRVDFESYSAITSRGLVNLTVKECMLLSLLTENEGKIIERDKILDNVWGYERYPSTRTIDNLILRLRRYFEDDPKQPRYILSQYGKGYMFIQNP
jgi:two-component system alkaline phosphatase synthesis response regulator PhoP